MADQGAGLDLAACLVKLHELVESYVKNAKEYKKQVEDLEDQIFDANSKIELNRVRTLQFDKLSSDYNDLVITASKSETEKARLQSKLQKISKELEELKKTIVPDDVIKQLKHDVEHLNRSLDEREKYLKKNTKHLEDAIKSEKQARKAYENLQANFDARIKKITDKSERKLRV